MSKGYSRFLKIAFMTCSVLTVQGCSSLDNRPPSSARDTHGKSRTLNQIFSENAKTAHQKRINEAVELLLAGDYTKASHHLNTALLEDPTNPWLHHLNALSYQLQAERGDFEKYDLAAAGYEQALKFDPSNALSSLQLGRVKSKQKKYQQAQEEFANTLIIDPTHREALYELAMNSYLAGDLKTAQVAINRALTAHPSQPEILKAAALISAAAGRGKVALEHLSQYKAVQKNHLQGRKIENRLKDWNNLYKNHIILAQAEGTSQDTSSSDSDSTTQDTFPLEDTAQDPSAQATASPSSPAITTTQIPNHPPQPGLLQAPTEQMVVIDAIVLRVSENGSTAKGNNILETFSITLAPGTHMYGRSKAPSGTSPIASAVFAASGNVPAAGNFNPSSTDSLSVARTFTQGVSFGNVVYSLQIANATQQHLEVIGRPSLVASVSKLARFFSGTELTIGLVGTNGGNLAKTPVGVTLEVTPLSIQGDKVTLDIKIYGSVIADAQLFQPTSSNPANATNTFTRIGISKVETSVQVNFGETIMLGGITERIDESTKDGFPVLQDIPILQYLFSRETTASERKSVMYLMTPRKYENNRREVEKFFKEGTHLINLTELEQRNKNWYKPEYNTKVTLHHLASLHREFRTGDLDPIHWNAPENLADQTAQVLSFLYY